RRHNELTYMENEPSYNSYEEDFYTHVYEQPKLALEGMRFEGELTDVSTGPPTTVLPGGVECFAPGTPVWTQAGPVSIEQIKVGDLVLSQDPSTGELAYQPVVETTVGPLSQVVSLNVGDEKIISTLGHRYWVNGHGW